MNKTKIYTDHNVKTDIIINLKIGIIGFGNQGKAQALNLKDSGINVVIGLRKGSLNKKNAIDHGFKVYSIEEVVTKCDIICLLIPDEQIGAVYKKDIKTYQPDEYTVKKDCMKLPIGVEPMASTLLMSRSNQLSYERFII